MGYDSGQTEERDVKTMPGRCGTTVNPYRILKKDADADEVIQAAAGTDFPVGVSGNGSENNSNTYAAEDPVRIKYAGIVYINMAGTGVRYDRVMSNATGQGIRHVNTDGVYVIGYAMEAWTDGQTIPVMIDRCFVGDYTVS